MKVLIRTVVVLLALFVILVGGSAWLVPKLVRDGVASQVPALLGRQATVGEVSFNPFRLRLRVHDLALLDQAGAKPEVSLDQFEINVSSASLFRLAPVVEAITVTNPKVFVTRETPDRFSFSDILERLAARPASPEPAGPPPRFSLNNLSLTGGEITFDDKVGGKQHTVRGLQIGVPFVSTLPYAAHIDVTPKLEAVVNGSAFALGGTARPFDTPRSSSLQIKIADFGLEDFAGAVPGGLPVLLKRARLDVDASLLFQEAGQDTQPVVRLEGQAALRELDVRNKADEALIGFKSLAVDKFELEPMVQSFKAERITLSGPEVWAKRAANGQINLLDVADQFKKPAADKGGEPAKDESKPWTVAIGTVALEDGKLDWRDDELKADAQVSALGVELGNVNLPIDAGQPVAVKVSAQGGLRWREVPAPKNVFKIDSLQFEAPRVVPDMKTPVDFSLQSKLQGKGDLSVKGTVAPEPMAAKVQVDAKRIDLGAFTPLLADKLNATVNSIVVGASGNAEYSAATPKQAMRAAWAGSAEVADLHLIDKLNAADFLRWRRLAFKKLNVKVDGDALKADLGDISLEDFFARAILNDKGSLNLTQIVAKPGDKVGSITAEKDEAAGAKKEETAKQEAAKPAPAKAEPPADPSKRQIRVGNVKLARGQINFTDNFIKPNYHVNLTGVQGGVSPMSSTNPAPADVQIAAKVDNDAPVDITGKLNPLGPRLYTDITASAKGVQLPALTPYSGRYAGYPIERGSLSMDVHYKIQDGKLEASNHVFLDQLTFGERIEGEGINHLPVQLAVALLKDRDGRIDINLPISGSLDDPEFSIGGVIIKVIVNLITKAVTAPFTLLASVLGGSSEELSHIDFAPGSAVLDDAARQRIATLVKALHDRESLKLDVAGRVNTAVDTDGLRKQGVEAMVAAQQRKDLGKAEGDLPPLDPAQRAKYLADAYKGAKIEGKPRNLVGFTKTLPQDDMQSMLEASVPAGPDQLRDLAIRRGQAVMAEFRAAQLSERAFLVAPKIETKEGETGKTSGVEFNLK